jgi:hypothetical protein
VAPDLIPLIAEPDALASVSVGLSVSTSPDLARLGLHESHVELTLGEIARVVILAAGRLVYGGHLEPDGYTAFLQGELEKYGRPRSLLVCLPWPVHRELALDELQRAEAILNVKGEIEYLAADGTPGPRDADRGAAPVPVDDAQLRASALTAMRRRVTGVCDARVLVGGKRDGFQGEMPGVIEEAILAIRTGKPVFLAGGFGGATHDAAAALGLPVDGWPQLALGRGPWLDVLTEAAREVGYDVTSNGLTEAENLRLSATHRPSDIATLVAVGLSRLRRDGRFGVSG